MHPPCEYVRVCSMHLRMHAPQNGNAKSQPARHQGRHCHTPVPSHAPAPQTRYGSSRIPRPHAQMMKARLMKRARRPPRPSLLLWVWAQVPAAVRAPGAAAGPYGRWRRQRLHRSLEACLDMVASQEFWGVGHS